MSIPKLFLCEIYSFVRPFFLRDKRFQFNACHIVIKTSDISVKNSIAAG